MRITSYNPKKDENDVIRILKEVGWVEGEDDKGARIYLQGSDAVVVKIDGAAECFAGTMPATIKYLDEDLSFAAVTGVVTSRIARKQGLAGKLTARVVATAAENGALMAGLGIFEQGYYNRLGFGSGVYENWISFDPAKLKLNRSFRSPKRLTADDFKLIQAALENRKRGHGSISILRDNSIHAELHWIKNGFGLGYFDGPDEKLSHFVWLKASGEIGPYDLAFYAYQDGDQFMELMALVKSLGDQVRMVKMREPAGIQMQDLVDQPFKWRQLTEKTKFQNISRSSSYYQFRICDLPGCMAKTKLPFGKCRFNLDITDPIAGFLPKEGKWKGITGKYIISLGSHSSAIPGKDNELPTMSATCGAFTRLWMGVKPASGLAITDEIKAPAELLNKLDLILRLPEPKPEWDF